MFFRRPLFYAVLAVFLISLNFSNLNPASARLNSGLDPKPEAGKENTIEAQLSRYKGQTQFLSVTAQPFFLDRRTALERSAPRAKTGGKKREQQEADVFKIGEDGLLYLLNTKRGLQTIDFSAGAKTPKLKGRAPLTGFWPEEMFLLNDKLYVLEVKRLDWDYAQRSGVVPEVTRIVSYKLVDGVAVEEGAIEIQGDIADRRIVGNVLYLALRTRPTWGRFGTTNTGERSGKVVSYDLSKPLDQLQKKPTDELELDLATIDQNKMNIVEVMTDGVPMYYLIAVGKGVHPQREYRWRSWLQNSRVEVVNISDKAGDIRSEMIVNTRGQIRERSATSIVNQVYLTTVSNAPSSGELIVETFKLFRKRRGERIVSQDEAERIKRDLVKIDGKLVAGDNVGKNTFVKVGDKIERLFSNDEMKLKDLGEFGASLRDVRFRGSRNQQLFVFWVPQNMIDPMDVLVIKGGGKIKHINRFGDDEAERTALNGRIERSEIVTFGERAEQKTYVLALGYENIEGERFWRQSPIAVILEIIDGGRDIQLRKKIQVGNKNTYLRDLNNEDKFVEFVPTNANGQGLIVFRADEWGENYRSGGKFVQYDLSAAARGAYDEVFSPGKMLVGNSSYIRRLFSNQIEDLLRLQLFSEQSISTYDVQDSLAVAEEDKVAEALSVLELARNVRDFVTIGNEKSKIGVQIISDNDSPYYWGWGRPTQMEDKTTELRVVKAHKADSEKADVMDTETLKGQYSTHLVDADAGTLWVLTSQQKLEDRDEQEEDEARRIGRQISGAKAILRLYRLKASGEVGVNALQLQGTAQWEEDLQATRSFPWRRRIVFPGPQYQQAQASLIWAGKDQVLVATPSRSTPTAPEDGEAENTPEYAQLNLRLILPSDGVGIQNVELQRQEGECKFKADLIGMVQSFGDSLTVQFTQYVYDAKRKTGYRDTKLRYAKNFLATVKLNREGGTYECGKPVNVPGTVIASEDGRWVAKDDKFAGFTGEPDHRVRRDDNPLRLPPVARYDVNTLRTLVAVHQVADGVAELTDVHALNDNSYESLTLLDDKTPELKYILEPNAGYRGRYSANSMTLINLSLDDEGTFLSPARAVRLRNWTDDKPIIQHMTETRDGKIQALISLGSELGVLSIDGLDQYRWLPVRTVDVKLQKSEKPQATAKLVTSQRWGFSGGFPHDATIGYDAGLNAYTVSHGMYGVTQFFVEE